MVVHSAKSVFADFFAKVIILASGFFVGIFLARILGPELFGTYRTLRSLATLLFVFVSFFKVPTIIYFSSKESKKNEVFWTFLSLSIAISFVFVSFLLLLSPLISGFYSFPTALVALALFELFFISQFPIVSNYLKGVGNFKDYAKFSAIYSFFRVLIIPVAFLSNLFYIFLWRNFVWILVYFSSVPILVKNKVKFPKINFKIMKEAVRYNIPLFISGVPAALSSSFLVAILGKISPKEAAFYSIAFLFSQIISIFPTSLSEVGLFKMSSKKSREELYEVVRKVAKYSSYTSAFLLLSYFIFGKEIIRLILSSKYLPSLTPLLILSLAYYISAAHSGASFYFYRFEETEKISVMQVARAVALLISVFFLVPKYRAIGAALSFLISTLVSIAFLYYFVHKKGLLIGRTYILKSLFAGFPAFAIGKYLSFLLPTKISVLLVPPTSFFVYLLALYFLKGFDEYDKEILKATIKEVRKMLSI